LCEGTGVTPGAGRNATGGGRSVCHARRVESVGDGRGGRFAGSRSGPGAPPVGGRRPAPRSAPSGRWRPQSARRSAPRRRAATSAGPAPSRGPAPPLCAHARHTRCRSASLDLPGVQSGNVLVQLLAHDGFTTTASEPIAIEISRRPYSAVIMRPQTGRRLIAGRTMRMWEVVTESTGEPVEDIRVHWLINGEETAGQLDAWVAAPPAGDHECTLVVDGETAVQSTVRFSTVDTSSEEPASSRAG